MTDPLLPLEPDPAPRRVLRDLTGLFLVLAGVAVLLWVLSTVDWRWPVGVAAAAVIGGGLYLGRDRADEGD